MISLRTANPARIAAVRACRFYRIGVMGILLLGSALTGIMFAAPEGRADLSLGTRAATDSRLALESAGQHRAEALAHYSMALQLEEEGKMREALGHFREVLKADPSNSELAAHTAEVAMNFAGRDEALKILRENIAANPQSPRPSLNWVRFLSTYAADDPFEAQAAMKAMNDVLEKFPHSAEVYREAVTMHLSAGFAAGESGRGVLPIGHREDNSRGRAEAVRVMEKALQQEVRDANFWLATGRAAQEVWPLGQAEDKAGHLAKVNAFFQRALAAAAEQPALRLQVAQYYLLTNQLPDATAICEKLAADPKNLQARKILYRLHDAAGRKTEALTLLEQIVKDHPTDLEQRKLLAAEYWDQIQREARDVNSTRIREFCDKAIAQHEAVIQLGGGDAADYDNLSRLLIGTQQHERLVNLSERSTRLFPEIPRFQKYAATSLMALEKYDKAIDRFAEAEALTGGTSLESLDDPARFYFQYGVALERAGRIEDSSRRFEKSIALTPQDDENKTTRANTMNYLGYMWLERGLHLDKAGDLIRQANELVPDNPAFVDSLGWFHFKKGDFREAVKELLRAESLLKEPQAEDAEIIDHIAQAYQQLGDKAKAEEYFHKALKLDPENKKTQSRLDELLEKKTQKE